MTTSTKSHSRRLLIGIWVLRILLGLLFLAAAVMKLTSQPQMVAEFQQVGYGDWFRYLTAALEVIGAVAVLLPRISVIGAAILLLVDVGAFFAQVMVLHMDWIHPIIIGALLVLLIRLQRRARSTSASR